MIVVPPLLPGHRLGDFIVIEDAPRDAARRRRYLCRCTCGNERIIQHFDATRTVIGPCQSCNKAATPVSANKHQNGYRSPPRLLRLWRSMKRRVAARLDYQAKGITVCPEWFDYAQFERWAMMAGWREGITLDRRDNGLGYTPENCRFASRAEQTLNRDCSTPEYLVKAIRHIANEGEVRSPKAIARLVGSKARTVASILRGDIYAGVQPDNADGEGGE